MGVGKFDAREFFRGLDNAADKLELAMTQTAREGIAEITGQAVIMAPVDEGTLRGSGSYFVQGRFVADTVAQARGKANAKPDPNRSGGPEVRPRSKEIRATVGFNQPYAAIQHEEDYRHPQGGEKKYLEKAIRKIRPKIRPLALRFAKRAGF